MTRIQGDHYTTHPPSQKESLFLEGAVNFCYSWIYSRIQAVEVHGHGKYQ
ncbi:MAG: hypothetical protein HQ542_12150 [Bacteroidia bacterium]|nr:hypothetical protein [Bacteroidia bacterium]